MWAQSTSLPDIDEEHWSLSRWNATFHFQKERNTITLYLLFRQWSSLHGSLLNVFLLLLVCMKNFQKSLVDVRLPLESVLNKDYHHNINCTCWVTLQFPCYHALITIDEWLTYIYSAGQNKRNNANAKLMQWMRQAGRGYVSELTSICVSSDASGRKGFF